eukprot:CAMPEP_0175879564 /NCGR_PEP_ID=MMETSP0107_2-20121207/41829_1 /TAXON_ID=195067 ORGANISM="Goniomonas pacifica, Strain CCMP1869" /NCGR_SAMPLE_ID=MMETSP0107_2 /ASSEMBLY_ACC=CAM_ASM_000203 /LENGTH=174 /DNA_ID=CAMNT_0017199205 /DNA_START=104 /DNA_END=624 /DNA_ORIENTATION=-
MHALAGGNLCPLHSRLRGSVMCRVLDLASRHLREINRLSAIRTCFLVFRGAAQVRAQARGEVENVATGKPGRAVILLEMLSTDRTWVQFFGYLGGHQEILGVGALVQLLRHRSNQTWTRGKEVGRGEHLIEAQLVNAEARDMHGVTSVPHPKVQEFPQRLTRGELVKAHTPDPD